MTAIVAREFWNARSRIAWSLQKTSEKQLSKKSFCKLYLICFVQVVKHHKIIFLTQNHFGLMMGLRSGSGNANGLVAGWQANR